MKKFWPYLILLFIIAAVVYLWQVQRPANIVNLNNENSTTGEIATAPLAVNFVFTDNRTVALEYPYNEQAPESLFKITKDLATQQNWTFIFEDYGELGILVTQIDNQINGADNQYWQYYVNDQQPQVAVEDFIPASGDEIFWKFTVSEF